MSTKASLVHGKDFHFYNECLDEHNVYLQLSGKKVEAHVEIFDSQTSVTVKIPKRIMKLMVEAFLKEEKL